MWVDKLMTRYSLTDLYGHLIFGKQSLESFDKGHLFKNKAKSEINKSSPALTQCMWRLELENDWQSRVSSQDPMARHNLIIYLFEGMCKTWILGCLQLCTYHLFLNSSKKTNTLDPSIHRNHQAINNIKRKVSKKKKKKAQKKTWKEIPDNLASHIQGRKSKAHLPEPQKSLKLSISINQSADERKRSKKKQKTKAVALRNNRLCVSIIKALWFKFLLYKFLVSFRIYCLKHCYIWTKDWYHIIVVFCDLCF